MESHDSGNVSFADELDPAELTLQANRSIYELRQQRDEDIKTLMSETTHKMAVLRARVTKHKEEQNRKKTRQVAQCISKLHSVTRQIRDTEAAMLAVVQGMDKMVADAEQAMLAGLEERAADAEAHRLELGQGLMSN